MQTRNPKPRTSHHSQAFSDLTHASQLKVPNHENFGSEFLTLLKPLKFRIMGPDSNSVRHETFWADPLFIRTKFGLLTHEVTFHAIFLL